MAASPLSSLSVGERGMVVSLLVDDLLRRRLLDLGIVPETVIEVIRKSPVGDPTAYLIKGSIISLRKNEANKILVMSYQ